MDRSPEGAAEPPAGPAELPQAAEATAAASGGGGGGGEPAPAAAADETLDPTMVAMHSYLGDVDDIQGGAGGLLEEGRVYRLPVLPLDGLVLSPGNTLPLRLSFRGDRALVQQALAAPAPLTRLIAVVCCQRSYFTPQLMLQRVGCVAEIRKMDGSGTNLLAKGRQRVEVQLEAVVEGGLQLSSVPVKVLPEPRPLAVPREAVAGLAWHSAALYATYDAWQLARRARRLFHSIAPKAREFQGSPLELSYHLLSNLPVDDDVRQQLLEAPTADARLRAECRLLQALGVLCCRTCGAELAHTTDALQMSEDGISGCYVNSHAYVHDICTLSQVSPAVLLEGEPETAHSWFPGYAWICAYCACGSHLGWKFVATRPGLQPDCFWGMRRPTLRAGGAHAAGGPAGTLLASGGSSSEDGAGGWTTGSEDGAGGWTTGSEGGGGAGSDEEESQHEERGS